MEYIVLFSVIMQTYPILTGMSNASTPASLHSQTFCSRSSLMHKMKTCNRSIISLLQPIYLRRRWNPELNGASLQATYGGSEDEKWARLFLASVTANPKTVPTQSETASFISDLSRVDWFLPILQVDVCFLRLPPGFPAVPQYFNHVSVGPSPSRNRTCGFPASGSSVRFTNLRHKSKRNLSLS